MNKEQAVTWLKLLDAKVPASQNRGGWVLSDCPLGPWRHEGGKSAAGRFGVKIEGGDSFCNCYSCGWHGSQTDLMIYMRHLNGINFSKKYPFGQLMQLIATAEEQAEIENLDSPDIEEVLFGPKAQLHEFPQWWIESFPKAAEVPFARDYLIKRGVPESVWTTMDIRCDTEQERVCFPVKDFKGTFVGLHGRAVHDEAEPRYRMYRQAKKNNPVVWLGEHYVDFNKPIVTVEGPFDLTSVYRVYRNVVSPLFSNPSFHKLKRMADALEWVTFYDRGTGGNKGREKIDDFVKGGVVNHVMPPKGFKDPGAMPVEAVAEALQKFVKLDEIILA